MNIGNGDQQNPNSSASVGASVSLPAMVRHSPRSAAVSSIYKRPHSEQLSPPNSPKLPRKSDGTGKIRLDLLTRKLKLQRQLKKRNIAHVSEHYFLQYYNGNVLDHEVFMEKNKKTVESHVAVHSIVQQVTDFEDEVWKQLTGNQLPSDFAPQSRKSAGLSSSTVETSGLAEKVGSPAKDAKSPTRSKSPRSSGTFLTPKSPCSLPSASGSSASRGAVGSKGQARLRSPVEGSIERAAKQEAQVLSRVAELRKQGLWSQRQLPKCADPLRAKTHWDYLLDEMHWMAIDFGQERKWKRAAARKLARDIAKIDREQKEKEVKMEREKEKDLRRIASTVAKEIRGFWKGVEKVVDYKSTMIVEAKKQKALDRHLDYIVDQTEKFSSLVKEGLNKPAGTPSVSGSKTPSVASKEDADDKEDYLEESEDEDDERTIEKDEAVIGSADVDEEVSKLQKESEKDIQDIFDELPPEYLEYIRRTAQPSVEDSDSDKTSGAGTSEKRENDTEMTSRDSSRPESRVTEERRKSDGEEQDLDDMAEEAERFLPKGFTLDTTKVVTNIPHLLRHKLREYQHVGLDWLVALYDKDLNGILADEMGLGKTIQTIALLAHLACEKNNWGPHLIVVPTSVMLNWEMEFKKWCPGFKILTYYGSQKERKEKRKGWSKANVFHVCITSYKLVIQDFRAFRQKHWEYFVLDEAQHIKNFKSQRWQMLLGFNSRRRLLLTGTPLQNNLMELWSLMHFLMPHVFGSHRDFKDWFSNPLMGMIEGSQEFDAEKVQRLHKILRPFILRRLKADVEKQMPKKFEHVVACKLSKRQRYLYDDYMSKGTTREQIRGGNVMSVLNTLMQLRKVCNHPNLFEPRPIYSPLALSSLEMRIPAMLMDLTRKDAVEDVRVPDILRLNMEETKFKIKRTRSLMAGRKLVAEIDGNKTGLLEPRPPAVPKFKFSCAKPIVKLSSGHTLSAEIQARPHPTFTIPAELVKQSKSFVISLPFGPGNSPRMVPFTLGTNEDTSEASPPPITFKQATADHPSPSARSRSPSILTLQPSSLPGRIPMAVPISQATAGSHAEPGTISLATMPETVTSGMRTIAPRARVVIGTKPRLNPYNPGPGWHPIQRLVQNIPVGTTPIQGQTQPRMFGDLSRPQRAVISVQEIKPKEPPKEIRVQPMGATGPIRMSASPNWRPLSAKLNTPTTTGPNSSPQLGLPHTGVSTTPSTSSGQSSSFSSTRSSPSMVPSESIPNLPSPAAFEPPSAKRQKVDVETSTVPCSSSSSLVPKQTVPTPPAASEEINSYPELKNEDVDERLREWRKAALGRLAKENVRRCSSSIQPVFGADGLKTLAEICKQRCHLETFYVPRAELDSWQAEIMQRFLLIVPPVFSESPRLRGSSSGRSPHWDQQERLIVQELETLDWPVCPSPILFPELRLIEYDCGKLQAMASLLRDLKQGEHRCLIFTQMSKMLDVLEAFLSYHGYKYLRLDGATKIEHRQILMERFNMDSRIFCFILSTRSGGLGVNLTGADTVIFYDSDWNPTMDAQAQDRCHRIGQTRDVHIYRLISQKTVEENILKKASQKRKLGELAIEEAGFTAEFFKKSNLRDLFDLGDEEERSIASESGLSQQELEQAMLQVEDTQDVVAAKVVRAEAVMEEKEFEENQVPASSAAVEPKEDKDPDIARVEGEMQELMEQLTPVERYAVKYLDREHRPDLEEEIRLTEEEIEQKKRDWEEDYQRNMEEEAMRKQEEEDEDDLALAYFVKDGLDQLVCPLDPSELMPIWLPPSPPSSDLDEPYIDPVLGFWYETEPMTENQLPPIQEEVPKPIPQLDKVKAIEKSERRVSNSSLTVLETIANVAAARKHHGAPKDRFSNLVRELDPFPRSLFDVGTEKLAKDTRKPLSPPPPSMESDHYDGPEWNVTEDLVLLQAVTKGLELPVNLLTVNSGHSPNWDYVAAQLKELSHHYRSPRQCSLRYLRVVQPREEGKLVAKDPITKKERKIAVSAQEMAYVKKGRVKTIQQFQYDGRNVLGNSTLSRIRILRTSKSHRLKKFRRHVSLTLNSVSPTPSDMHVGQLDMYAVNYQAVFTPLKLAELKEQRAKEAKLKNEQQKREEEQKRMEQAVAAAQNAQIEEAKYSRQLHAAHSPHTIPIKYQADPHQQQTVQTGRSQSGRGNTASVRSGVSPITAGIVASGRPGNSVAQSITVSHQPTTISFTPVHPTVHQSSSTFQPTIALQAVTVSGSIPARILASSSTAGQPATVIGKQAASGLVTAVYRGTGVKQRTPPGTPSIAVTSYVQTQHGGNHTFAVAGRTMIPVSTVGTGTVVAQSIERSGQPVRVQARRQNVVQAGGGTSFLVAAASPGQPALVSQHQSRIGGSFTPRNQFQSALGKKGALPKIATMSQIGRSGGTIFLQGQRQGQTVFQPVRQIRGQQSQMIATSTLLQQSSQQEGSGGTIPSILNIMPIGRVETVHGGNPTVSQASAAGSPGQVLSPQSASVAQHSPQQIVEISSTSQVQQTGNQPISTPKQQN